MTWLPLTPGPPGWRVDWPAIVEAFDWARAMEGCPQDPVHHAEGDVAIHTRMVCEVLADMPAWRALPAGEREIVFAACLLHDVAKPETTKEEGGRVTARGHSVRGAIRAREILWRLGAPPPAREAACGLVRWHQLPFFCIEQDVPLHSLISASQIARPRHLALVCEADGRGRICGDLPRLLDNIALFSELAAEEGCLDGPWRFASDHSRVQWFLKGRQGDPRYAAFDDTRCEVILMSGLPGSGKDWWVRNRLQGWPVITLDEIRRELKVHPRDDQGAVINLARERAREFLREGRGFVWNATNISKQMRQMTAALCFDYRARVRIVCREAPPERLFAQNKDREAVVPENVLRRLISRWEMPDVTEAHAVEWGGERADEGTDIGPQLR